MLADNNLRYLMCPVCGVHYTLESSFYDMKCANGGIVRCPNGHEIRFTDGEKVELQRQVQSLKNTVAHEKSRRESTYKDVLHWRDRFYESEKRLGAVRGAYSGHLKRAKRKIEQLEAEVARLKNHHKR